MIVTGQHGDRRELALVLRRIPALAEHRDLLRLHELVLKPLGEHAGLAPPPHFLPALIPHYELVRLSTRETQLDHPGSIVSYVELELDLTPRMYGKRRAQLRRRLSIRRRRESLLVTSGSFRKSDGSGTKKRNYETICHHGQATSARGAGYITKRTFQRVSTYQQLDDRAILK